MQSFMRLAVLCAAMAVSCGAAAADRWFWVTAQCRDDAHDDVYMFAAVAHVANDEAPYGDEYQHSRDSARFGFGIYANRNYAEDHCGGDVVDAQNMHASNSFDTRGEAAEALDDYIGGKEADGHAWVKVVRVADYVEEGPDGGDGMVSDDDDGEDADDDEADSGAGEHAGEGADVDNDPDYDDEIDPGAG